MHVPRFFMIIILITVVAVTAPAQQRVAGLLASGDARQTRLDPAGALALYRQAEKLAPRDPEVLWRIAKIHVDLSKLERNEKVRDALIATGLDHAERAIAANPGHSMAHASKAIVLGQKAVFAGYQEKLDLSKQIKASADKALALDGNNAVAMIVLGIWHREVADLNWALKLAVKLAYGGLPEASFEEAHRFLTRAVQIQSTSILPRLELAKTLIAMDRETEALTHLRAILSMPKTDIGDSAWLAEARELIREVE